MCKKEFSYDDKKCYKVRDHCHYIGKYRVLAHNICNLRNSWRFHDGSNYGYHFRIKDLAEEFEGQFKCLGENREVDKIFCKN